MSWARTRIGDVCLPTGLRDPRESPNELFRYIDVSAIDREKKVIVDAPEILGSVAPSRARKEIRRDDVIVSTVRPNLNAVAAVPESLDGHVASTGFCVLRPDPRLVLSEYLFFWVRTPEFIDTLGARLTNTS